MTTLLAALRELPGLTRVGAIALSVSLAGWTYAIDRITAIEARQDRQELVQRYVGCQLKEFVAGRNPDACDSLVEPDVIEYLRPRGNR
jgi:hypothetical protein